ncbi:MAG: HAD family hydrolase [Bacteroidales bacterium]|nr:HAD family hydrolase [Bacteroidales bacterium]
MEKAVFLDRDGVVNELIYHREQGIIDSPFTVAQLQIIDGVPEAIRIFHDIGYKIIIVSNQPGIAKKHMSMKTFEAIRQHIIDELISKGANIDAEYYCLHHPQAKVPELKEVCDCRKPKPGLIIKAAGELDIELKVSWMVGDGLTDIQAGKNAGCKTILIGKEKCELCRRMEQENARPDFICENLLQAASVIKNNNIP